MFLMKTFEDSLCEVVVWAGKGFYYIMEEKKPPPTGAA